LYLHQQTNQEIQTNRPMKLPLRLYLLVGGSFVLGFSLCFFLTTNVAHINDDDTHHNLLLQEQVHFYFANGEKDGGHRKESWPSAAGAGTGAGAAPLGNLANEQLKQNSNISTNHRIVTPHGINGSIGSSSGTTTTTNTRNNTNTRTYYQDSSATTSTTNKDRNNLTAASTTTATAVDFTPQNTTTKMNVDFTVIILTMSRAKSLKRLLDTLEATDYGGDKIHLIFKIDFSPKNKQVIDVAESFNFTHGYKSIFVAEQNMGLGRSWFNAWMPQHDNDYGIIFEDDIEVASQVWYKWIKKAWSLYDRDAEMSPNHMAGIALCRQTLIPLRPDNRHEVILNGHKPYLYRLVGSIGFSPHPRIWKKFVAWIKSIDLDTFDVNMPELVTSDAWNFPKYDRRQMWTQHFIYFSKQHNLFTLYQSLRNEKTLASHMREAGEHFKKTIGKDFELATKEDVDMDDFPESYEMLNKYDWDGKLIQHEHSSTMDKRETTVIKDVGADVPLCITNSLYQLCSAFKGVQLQECYANPESFVRGHFDQYRPSRKEKKAGDTIMEHGIRKISIGSARSGICDDVTTGQTICTDRDNFDLLKLDSWMNLFDATHGEGFDVLFAEHVLEHFEPIQAQQIAAISFALLKPGGVFRIAVPDGYKPSPSYQYYIRAGGTESNAGQNHMVAWTVESLPTIFENVGFEIQLKEYFTKGGKFVTSSGVFDNDGIYGKVKRSSKDERNEKPYKDVHNELGALFVSDLQEGEPMYTSLWFDAVKPSACNYTLSKK
jgi:Uncharacterized protein conserved in bacteria